MIFANTKIREDVHLQLGYHKQLISKDYVELFCGFYIFIILTSHACQHNSRGKLCCRHRFGGQMIAQMNLFRGDFFPMIDHRKKSPRNKFFWAIIWPPKRCRRHSFPRLYSLYLTFDSANNLCLFQGQWRRDEQDCHGRTEEKPFERVLYLQYLNPYIFMY